MTSRKRNKGKARIEASVSAAAEAAAAAKYNNVIKGLLSDNEAIQKLKDDAFQAADAKYAERLLILKSENEVLKKGLTAEIEKSFKVNLSEMEAAISTVETERDFYYEKLRGMEILLQVYEEKKEANEGSGNIDRVVGDIFKVMYATKDDVVKVDDDGNVSKVLVCV